MSDDKIVKSFYEGNNIPVTNVLMSEAIIEFVKTLDVEPEDKEVMPHPYAKDNKGKPTKFIPIQIIENKLNYYFGGLWQTKNFRTQVIVNELVGSIDLGIWHPVIKDWIWRTGSAGTQIKLRAEYTTNEQGKREKVKNSPLDIERKILNTLEADYPKLKSEAIKNAAKSFGATFGQKLNRETEDSGSSLDNVRDIEDILVAMEQLGTKEDLYEFFGGLADIQKTDPRVVKLFASKKSKLAVNGNS